MRSIPAVIALAAFLFLSACTSIKQVNQEKVLFSVDGEPVTNREFLYVYNKNNFNRDTTDIERDIREYLDLYINFKLKVKEARALGLHNTEAFITEFNTYRDELAKPFLTENKVTEQLVEEAYERLKEEIKASHILIKLPEFADPEDTLKALKRIEAIHQQAISGEDFGLLAKEHSEDPSARSNGGSLGYFTALQMVYPFENQAYKTPVDSISAPFRTKFGYHILKVEDKRPSLGEVKVSHIMIRATDGISLRDSILARNKIYEIRQKLENSKNWNELCSQFSEDLSSKSNGGAIPWFSMGNMIPSFAEAAFALDSVGEISKPVKSPYGWHLIRLDDRRGLESLAEMRPELEQKVKKDSRSELNQKMLIERLKKENSFVSNQNLADLAFRYADSTLLSGKWTYDQNDPKLSYTLFSIGGRDYNLEDFYLYLSENQQVVVKMSPKQAMAMYYDKFVEKSLIDYEKDHLAEKYEDYRMLEQEYRDGILLFQLMDDKVWSKAVQDSVGLERYYQENLENYRWGQRADAIIVNAANSKILEKVSNQLGQAFYMVDENPVDLPFNESNLELENIEKSLQPVLSKLEENKNLKLNVSFPASETALQATFDSLVEVAGISNQVVIEMQVEKQGNLDFSLLSSSIEDLETYINEENPLAVTIEAGLIEQAENDLLQNVEWAPGKTEVSLNDRKVLVFIKEIRQPEYKKLEEIKGTVISDYQNYLERNWVNELKMKYKVNVEQSQLQNIINKFEKS